MLPIMQIKVDDVAERVVVVGDPARTRLASEKLDDVRQIGSNREYVAFTGNYDGTPITIASHGVGSAGAGIAFTELCRAGATRLVRVGTAGGMQPVIGQGAVVVATGAVRDDGLTERLVPQVFPAIADAALSLALARVAATEHLGLVLTSDVFYPSEVLGSTLELWQRSGVLAVEMELAALLVIAALNGVRAAGIFAIDGNPLAAADTAMDNYQPLHSKVSEAIDAALDAALKVLAHS